MPIKARKCFIPISPSRWVSKVFLTCDNMLAVQFRRGQHVKKVLPHGPGAYLGQGGVPHVTCLYPGTQGELAERLFELAQVWSYGGEWVHAYLYKKFGYQLAAPPDQCGDCTTACSLEVEPADPQDGQAVTITCTVTNIDGSPTKGDAPAGTVTFYVDGAAIGTCTLPAESEPDAQNAVSCSTGWTASCQPQDTHSIEAVFTPAEADYAPTSCSASLTVTNCGVPCAACPEIVKLPQTLYATLSDLGGCSCLAGTYPLTWNGLTWMYANAKGPCFFDNFGQLIQLGLEIIFQCDPFVGATLVLTCGPLGAEVPATSISCSPFHAEFLSFVPNPPPQSCCSGTVNVSITA